MGNRRDASGERGKHEKRNELATQVRACGGEDEVDSVQPVGDDVVHVADHFSDDAGSQDAQPPRPSSPGEPSLRYVYTVHGGMTLAADTQRDGVPGTRRAVVLHAGRRLDAQRRDMSPAPADGSPHDLMAPPSVHRRGLFSGIFSSVLYRGWLLLATLLLMLALLWVQSLGSAVPLHPTLLQRGVLWAELIWLAPVPLALALWLGWFLFADAARPDPAPIPVPFVALGDTQALQPVRLVLRFVTRGDNQDVLRDSVAAAHAAFANYPGAGPYRIEVVSERAIDLAEENVTSAGHVAIFVVPHDYHTPDRSRFKARALTYLQSAVQPQPGDWCVYLDEESAIDTPVIAGLYRFVERAQARAARRGIPSPRLIGQGAILYQGGTWFFRGADALRTADDIGRFRLQYALGMPLFGVHGSYIVVSGEDDADLSFDVGTRNSLTEDAAWALRAWARGYRFGWVEGFLREQPPQRTWDFIRQRARWLSGIRLVLRDTAVPLRLRACLGAFTLLWQLSFLPFLVTVAAVIVHIVPPVWMRIPADFAWATFVLAYLQGGDIQARRVTSAVESSELAGGRLPRHDFSQRLETLANRIISWSLALCYIWYALLEAAGVLYSLKPKRDFFVIYKPSLTHAVPAEQHVSDLPAAPASASASLAQRQQA